MHDFLQWTVVVIDAIAAVMVLRTMMEPEAKALRIRLPLAAAAWAFAITAAFHTGVWRPQEWSDTVTLIVTALAAIYIVYELLTWLALVKPHNGD